MKRVCRASPRVQFSKHCFGPKGVEPATQTASNPKWGYVNQGLKVNICESENRKPAGAPSRILGKMSGIEDGPVDLGVSVPAVLGSRPLTAIINQLEARDSMALSPLSHSASPASPSASDQERTSTPR